MERHGGWEAFDRVVYVGDGGNDYCPILRLRRSVPPRSCLPSQSLTPLAFLQPRCGPRAIVPRALAPDRKGGRCGWSQVLCVVLGWSMGGGEVPDGELERAGRNEELRNAGV